MVDIGRRGILLGAGLVGGGMAAGRPAATGSSSGVSSSRPGRADWRALAASIDGDVVRRADDDYDRVRLLHNTRYDDRRPVAVVRVSDASDVGEAIRFARRFGLRCRARAGGHSYVGASTVDDGLVIDVRQLRSVRYDAATGTAALGAGTSTYRAKQLLADRGLMIHTGTCPTVGVTGLTLGGGLGVDSTEHGLSCDALVGITIVTGDGRVVRASEERDPELLWASRGGGGGSFGVVTSLRMRTSAARPLGVFSLTFPAGAAAAVVRGWSAHVERMPRSVWCNLQLVVDAEDGMRVVITGRSEAGEQDAAAAAVERSVGVDASTVVTSQMTPMEAVRHFGGGSTDSRGSWVAGSDVLATMTDRIAETLPRIVARRRRSGTVSRVILDPLVGAIRDPAVSTTAFPWRNHLAELQWFVPLPSTRPAAVRSARRWVAEGHDAVRGASVGAYVNRLEPGRPPEDYYGSNLQRLRRIKRRVDPDGFFRSPHGL